MLKSLFICFVVLMSSNLQAEELTSFQRQRVEKAMNAETIRVMKAMENQDFKGPTQKALNALVATAIQQLREKGYEQEANYWEADWQLKFANYFEKQNLLNLGDHKPLSKWLARFYKDLERLLGKTICHFFYLDDIFVFNYSIPVVFHPLGYKKEHWDSVEYKKHFVPFSAATAYWSTKIACYATLTGLNEFICSSLAFIPRMAMQDIIAPPLSDTVYQEAHK